MPFKSPKQQIYMKIHHPEIHDRWVEEYGNAPGLSDYLKRVKKNKKRGKKMKTKKAISKLTKISKSLDDKGLFKIADILDIITAEIKDDNTCKECGDIINKRISCKSCGWKESKLCPSCTMKKFGCDTCPKCGEKLENKKEAKKLTYKEKQAAPCVFPKTHPKVNDNKDHYPIPDLAHAQNALARSNQYKGETPPWFDGDVTSLQNYVKRAVYKKFPGLKSRKEKREGDKK